MERLAWSDRPVEARNLFNPAFCGIVLSQAIQGYVERDSRGMPFVLSFLVLPVILHERTRRALPRSTQTTFLSWIEKNQDQIIGFGDRVVRMKEPSRESLSFALIHQTIQLGDDARLVSGPIPVAASDSVLSQFTDDARECFKRATFLGTWFALAGSPTTVLTSFGLMP